MLQRIRVTLHAPDRYKRIFDFGLATVLFNLPVSVRKRLFAGRQHVCPVCDSHVSRFPILNRPLFAWCPICRSLQRHRLVWLFFQRRTHLLDGAPKRLLHIAPEPALTAKFQRVPYLDYLSADLNDPAAHVKMDICDIQFPDATFDAIYCSHVLEHVQDDRRALQEFNRVIRPGGWACILVPIMSDTTFEDPTVTDPIERERLFGQDDHVRRYGLDVKERIAQAGFEVTTVTTEDIATPGEVEGFGLSPHERIFYCLKTQP
jgi:hypothetical protein